MRYEYGDVLSNDSFTGVSEESEDGFGCVDDGADVDLSDGYFNCTCIMMEEVFGEEGEFVEFFFFYFSVEFFDVFFQHCQIVIFECDSPKVEVQDEIEDGRLAIVLPFCLFYVLYFNVIHQLLV